VVLLLATVGVSEGGYPIKSYNVELTDPYQSSTHVVKAIIHYPQTPDPQLNFPLIVFSPGFVQSDTFYDYLWQELVPLGYVVAVVGSYDYDPLSEPTWKARDQSFLSDYLRNESVSNPQSPVYHLINSSSTAAMGHSEGGVASLISGDSSLLVYPYHNNWTAIGVLSGCFPPFVDVYTAAAKYDKLPILWITGTRDCICHPSYNYALYSVSPSTCKYYINLVNASHCRFDNSSSVIENDLCWDAEVLNGCAFDQMLPLGVQEQRVLEYAVPWFQWHLKGFVSQKVLIDQQLVNDFSFGLLQYQYICNN